ncbi:MAG: efflux transporter outer membrane subunit [Oceanipulchritudo sp.]
MNNPSAGHFCTGSAKRSGLPRGILGRVSVGGVASLLWVLMPGCLVGPDYESPEVDVPADWEGTDHPGLQAAAPPASGTVEWWAELDAPELERLIREAMDRNHSLEVAALRLRRARALIGAAEARLLPDIGADAQYTRAYLSERLPVLDQFFEQGLVERDQELYVSGFDAAWELDLFGGSRRRVEAAEARAERVEAGLEDARISLVAELARNYFELRRSQRQLSRLERRIELQESLMGLAETRLDSGVGAETGLLEASARLEKLKAERPPLMVEEAAAAYRIAVLTAGEPGEVRSRLSREQSLPAVADPVPVGLPGELLRRRPDLRAAERALAEATALVGVQIAELYPKFALTGSVGSQAGRFGDLFASESGTWQITPGIQWNLFRGGAVRAQIDAAEDRQSAALASYRQTVLEAVAEVETRLTQYGRSLESRGHTEAVQARLRRSLELAKDANNAGVAGFASVLEAEGDVMAGEARLAAVRAEVLVALAALHKALGGGWERSIPLDTPE